MNKALLYGLLFSISLFFSIELSEAVELPSPNNRGVIGLRWGNSLRQVQEGMKRNDAKRKDSGKTLSDKQRRYAYTGIFFDREGIAEVSLYKGALWSISFVFKEQKEFYNDLLSSLRKQYGKEQGEEEAFIWSSGSTTIRLEKEDGQIYFSWFDAYVARSMKISPRKDTIQEDATEQISHPSNTQQIPYEEWTEEPGMNTPFPKGSKLIWGLSWGTPSPKAHLLMVSRNRAVFRGSHASPDGVSSVYSGSVQGKSVSMHLSFTKKDALNKIMVTFPPKSQKAESLFLSMLSRKLGSPMMRNNLKIWYVHDSTFVRDDAADGSVTYAISPIAR